MFVSQSIHVQTNNVKGMIDSIFFNIKNKIFLSLFQNSPIEILSFS